MDLKESKKLIKELTKRNQSLENENVALEMEVKASRKIIHQLKRDTELLAEYEEAIIDKDDLIQKFEKGKTVADKIIHNLKEEINVQGKEMSVKKTTDTEEKEKLENEISSLVEEIEKIQVENGKKEILVKDISEENKMLIEKMNFLEESNQNLLQQNQLDNEKDETKSLKDKLGLPDEKFVSEDSLKCKNCEENFSNKNDLKRHNKEFHVFEMRIKMMELEKKTSFQKTYLATSLVNWKQLEASEKRKPCVCRGVCRINHTKYNWTLSRCDEFYSKLQEMKALEPVVICVHSCKQCGENFQKLDDLEGHVKAKHEEPRESENGGSKFIENSGAENGEISVV